MFIKLLNYSSLIPKLTIFHCFTLEYIFYCINMVLSESSVQCFISYQVVVQILEKTKGALQASESAIRVPIYDMFCQLSNSLLGSLENIIIEKTLVHVNKKDFLSNIL